MSPRGNRGSEEHPPRAEPETRSVVVQLPEADSAMASGSDEEDFSVRDQVANEALPHQEAERVMGRIEELEEESESDEPASPS